MCPSTGAVTQQSLGAEEVWYGRNGANKIKKNNSGIQKKNKNYKVAKFYESRQRQSDFEVFYYLISDQDFKSLSNSCVRDLSVDKDFLEIAPQVDINWCYYCQSWC